MSHPQKTHARQRAGAQLLLAGLGVFLLGLANAGCGLSALVAIGAVAASSGGSSSNNINAPTVTAVLPATGSHAGGDTVTIVGTGFTDDATVTIGGALATGVASTSSGALTAVVPFSAAVGLVDISVSTPVGGTGTLASSFTYTNVTPTSGFGTLPAQVTGNAVISVVLSDPESDSLDITLEYDNGSGFVNIPQSDILSGTLLGLASSPTGVTHNLTWNTRSAFSTVNASGVVLRVVPTDTTDSQVGGSATSVALDVLNNLALSVGLIQPGDDEFNVALSYSVSDPDGDPISVTGLTYRDFTTGAVNNMSVKAGSQGLGAVAFNPGTNTTIWQSLNDLGYGNNRLVAVTVTVTDGTDTVSATSAPFFISNGPVADHAVSFWLALPNGIAAGDFRAGDGRRLPDLVAASTFPGTPGQLSLLENNGLDFQAAEVENVPTSILPGVGGGITWPGSPTNPFLNQFGAPSETTAFDVDNDNDADLITASSFYSVNGAFPLIIDATGSAFANAGADGVNGFVHVQAHQRTFTTLNDGADLDVAGSTGETAQAVKATNRAGIAPVASDAVAPDGGAGAPHQDNIGWYIQDLVSADLDGPAATNGSQNRDDLLILHGIGHLDLLFGGDARGAVVIRHDDGSGLQGTAENYYLDTSQMGAIPTHAAVGDVTSNAYAAMAHPTAGVTIAPGFADIVTANTGDNSLTFFLQTSPASFGPYVPPTYYSRKFPMTNAFGGQQLPQVDTRGVAIGDLNGDGANDVIAVGQFTRTVVVFIQDPTTTQKIDPGLPFRIDPNYSFLPLGSARLQAGRPTLTDMTGDGRVDILIPVGGNNEFVILVNLGNTAATAPGVTPAPRFSAPISFTSQFVPFDLALADFNGDRRLDVAAPAQLSADLSVYYQTTPGTIDGRFVPVPTGPSPFTIDVGDLDGNDGGLPELAIAISNGVEIYEPAGGSTPLVRRAQVILPPFFGAPPQMVLPANIFDVRIAQLDGAGPEDVVFALQTLIQGQSANPANASQPLEFTAGWGYLAGNANLGLVNTIAAIHTGSFGPIGVTADVGDYTSPGGNAPDGIPDVLLTQFNPQSPPQGIVLYEGLGGGAFAHADTAYLGTVTTGGVPVPDPTGQIGSSGISEVVDLDGDTYPDLVIGNGQSPVIHIWWNGGEPFNMANLGDFDRAPDLSITIGVPGQISQIVHVGDLNNDGLLDVAFTGFSVQAAGVVFQTAARTFDPVVPINVGGSPGFFTIGDLNSDGLNDLVIPWGTDNLVAVYYQDPSVAPGQTDGSSLLGAVTFATANTPTGAAVVDVNGDGANDLVVTARGASALNVFFQR